MKPDSDWFEFKGWLKNKEDGAVVGISEEPYSCPIARFLNEEYGGRHIVSGFDYKTVGVNSVDYNWRSLPDWAVGFVRLVDNGKYPTITKEMALELLDKVTGEDIYDR